MKKILIIAAIVATVASVYAGLDVYTGKNFTTVLSPVIVVDNSTAITSTTATAKSGSIVGLPGVGAVVASYQCNAGGADAVLAFKFYQCTATNTIGSEITALSFSVTNTTGFKVQALKPNTLTGSYIRAIVTPAGAVTNANVGAILVTE